MTISKLCADHLRQSHLADFGQPLKATHAREIVAAFFGYKSHAALLAEANYPLSEIEESAIMIPDVALIDWRLGRLSALPSNIPSAYHLARILADFLRDEGWFGGESWLYDTVETYVTEVYLRENDWRLMDELSGVMAETNAYFEEAEFDEVTMVRHDEGMVINVTGTYSGTNDEDRMFSGDKIDMAITVTLDLVAGQTCYHAAHLEAGGEVNDDWYEPDFEYQAPAAE